MIFRPRFIAIYYSSFFFSPNNVHGFDIVFPQRLRHYYILRVFNQAWSSGYFGSLVIRLLFVGYFAIFFVHNSQYDNMKKLFC